MKLVDELNIFPNAKVERRIPITDFIRQAGLEGNEQKLVENNVKTIFIVGALIEQTTSIRGYEDDVYNYETILVLHIRLKRKESVKIINDYIHKAFPTLIIAIYEYEIYYYVSTALKRLNRLDLNKSVIEDLVIEPILLTDLNLQSFSKVNLKEYYEDLHLYIYKLIIKNIIGFIPKANSNYKAIIMNLHNLKYKQALLKEQLKKEKMRAKKMSIDDELYEVERNIERIINNLQEEN